MSEYLKNLQEGVILTQSFHRTRDIPLTEDEIREKVKDKLENLEKIEDVG